MFYINAHINIEKMRLPKQTHIYIFYFQVGFLGVPNVPEAAVGRIAAKPPPPMNSDEDDFVQMNSTPKLAVFH